MTTIDQIKTLMRSGDIAGAEAQCRSQRIGRDVSPKRPQTRHGRVPTKVSKATSRKSQVASLWALAFFAFLAPLAARADIAGGPWVPPNNYEGFLFRNGYYSGPHGVLVSSACYGVPICLGVFALIWLFCRLRKKSFPNMKLMMSLAVFFCLTVGFLVVQMKEAAGQMLSMFGAVPPAYSRLEDTPEHRAEYDLFCIKWYDSNEPPPPGPIGIRPGQRHRNLPWPEIRDEVSPEVREAVRRFWSRREKRQEAKEIEAE